MATTKTKNTAIPQPNLKRDVDRAMLQAVMFQLGIIPIENTNHDMRRPLKQLSPEESRVLKRKFRKLWRKAMREQIGDGKTREAREAGAKVKYGVGKSVPSRAERNARKKLVFDELWESKIGPMVQTFNNAGTPVESEPKPKKAKKTP